MSVNFPLGFHLSSKIDPLVLKQFKIIYKRGHLLACFLFLFSLPCSSLFLYDNLIFVGFYSYKIILILLEYLYKSLYRFDTDLQIFLDPSASILPFYKNITQSWNIKYALWPTLKFVNVETKQCENLSKTIVKYKLVGVSFSAQFRLCMQATISHVIAEEGASWLCNYTVRARTEQCFSLIYKPPSTTNYYKE